MDEKELNSTPISEPTQAEKEAKRKAQEAERKKRAARAAAEAKRKYFEYYDDIKHDRNKEW